MVAPITTQTNLRTLDRAIVITVGVSKGGTAKSWIATNLAATLARKGHYVALIDSNTAANSHSDWSYQCSLGQNPGFHCYFEPTPYEQNVVQDLSGNFDVIIIDTPQYRTQADISRAWAEADLLVAPVTEEAPDFRFFLNELLALGELRQGKTIAAIPTRCTMLKRQTIARDFGDFLSKLQDAGIAVPRFEKGNYHLDYNQRVKSLPVRNIYYTPVAGDNCKPIQEWARKWEAHVEWLLAVLQSDGITLPAPRGVIDALPMFKETVTDEVLRHYGIKTNV